MILEKLMQYNMNKGPPRKGFDPEGYINSSRQKINFGGYDHVPYQFDDMIRNLEAEEVERVVEEYNQGLPDTGFPFLEMRNLEKICHKTYLVGFPDEKLKITTTLLENQVLKRAKT